MKRSTTTLSEMTDVQRAHRFIFLNKTCFNGLYRENISGQFNASYGRHKNPTIVDIENLQAIAEYLNKSDVEIKHSDYQFILDKALIGDFVYFDPPYAPMTKTANFAGYVKGGFSLQDQITLAHTFAELDKKGVKSNSNTTIIHDLYKDFNIEIVYASCTINCNATKCGKESIEVLVTNYFSDKLF